VSYFWALFINHCAANLPRFRCHDDASSPVDTSIFTLTGYYNRCDVQLYWTVFFYEIVVVERTLVSWHFASNLMIIMLMFIALWRNEETASVLGLRIVRAITINMQAYYSRAMIYGHCRLLLSTNYTSICRWWRRWHMNYSRRCVVLSRINMIHLCQYHKRTQIRPSILCMSWRMQPFPLDVTLRQLIQNWFNEFTFSLIDCTLIQHIKSV